MNFIGFICKFNIGNGKKRLGKYLSRFSFTIFVLVNIKIDVKKSANGE